MLTAATRVLRLVFEPGGNREKRAEGPLVDFVAYSADAVFAGSLRLAADRLTDMLNAADELELRDVVCVARDGRVVEADRAAVQRAELLAVKAGNPRGNPRLRHSTRQTAVAAGAGDYRMHGYLHARPGSDPLVHLGRRPPMVPLTDALIAYPTAQGWHRDTATTLILNRDATDWLRLAREDDVARLGMPGPA